VRFFEKSKFGRKLLVWVAISPLGRSKVYFHESKGAVNSEIYSRECVEKRLKPFLDKHGNNYIFWPDLASAHYAKDTLATYARLGINYVMKEQNPPNLPMLRPIETFWSHLKAKVYSNGWEAKSIQEMKKRISYCLTKFRTPYLKNLFKDTKKWIIRAEKRGVVILREK